MFLNSGITIGTAWITSPDDELTVSKTHGRHHPPAAYAGDRETDPRTYWWYVPIVRARLQR